VQGFRIKTSPVRRAFLVARFAAVSVLAFAVLVAVGYLSGASGLYRPTPGGPATHPITLVITVWLGFAMLRVSPVRKVDGAAHLLFVLAAGLALLRLLEMIVLGHPPTAAGSLFGAGAGGSQHADQLGNTGLNTLVTGLLIAAGQLLRARVPRAAMFAASIAPVSPLVAVFGYSFGFEHFHGEMSPITAGLLLPLSLVGVMSFVRRPMLRPLFADSAFGRGARMEILAGFGFPWLLGQILAHQEVRVTSNTAIQSAVMAMFAVTVVVIKTRAHAVTEIQRRHSVRALQAAAATDQLTGLANRHGAKARIDALEGMRPVGVILADLDHFKEINDIWGHAVGDRVLADVAGVLRGGFGFGETVARWGGEEFLVVLPGCDLERTQAVAEQLRSRLAALPGPSGAVGEVTASFGVSERHAAEDTLEHAMHRADAALYAAKDGGRDKVMRNGCAGCSAGAGTAFAPQRLRVRGAAV